MNWIKCYLMFMMLINFYLAYLAIDFYLGGYIWLSVLMVMGFVSGHMGVYTMGKSIGWNKLKNWALKHNGNK